jgi:hypothetical protein
MHHSSLLPNLFRSQTVLHAEDVHEIFHQYIQDQLVIFMSIMSFRNNCRELFKTNIVFEIDVE